MNAIDYYDQAVDLFSSGNYNEAARIFLTLREQRKFAPLCDYYLASISNILGDPLTAYHLYYRAFAARADVMSLIFVRDSAIGGYVFKGLKTEREEVRCPLCGSTDTQPKWCYPLTEAHGFNEAFNPIRLWMYCEPCHHMYARYFPENTFLYNDNPRTPDPSYFPYYSNIFDHISRYTTGTELLEVGFGACEGLLAAQESGYNALGIDVIEKHVAAARERFNLNVQVADFVEFRTDKKFDVIIMGDVIEHVSDPVAAMQNANELLNEDGALWVSTPNFDSAFSIAVGHNDPMKKQQYHLNYFSRVSFFALLERCGFVPVEYNISSHYNGSMEIIAVKSK